MFPASINIYQIVFERDFQKHLSAYIIIFFIFLMGRDWAHLVLRPLFGLLYQPQMIDDGDCGAVGGMRIGRETEVLGENLPQCRFVHHKSHMTWPGARTRAAAVGSRRLTAWAMARSSLHIRHPLLLTSFSQNWKF
jgi:hypothetical protein